jgi:hypothetical protein
MRRIVSMLIATFSSFLLAATVVPAANAKPDTTITAPAAERTVDRTSASERGALPLHDVRWTRRGETQREGIFFTKGRVTTWKGKVVKLQSSRSRTGRWTTVKRDRTTKARGVWSIRFDGKIGRHYRVLIPKANWARATRVYVGKIVAQ